MRVLPLLLATACTTAAPSRAPAPTRITDGLFDVGGGLSLHLHCEGQGVPAVILDAGLGDSGVSWSAVAPDMYAFTRACSFDRAGEGYSGGAPKSHTSAQMVAEQHALLRAAKVDAPYVLVGHSFGGLNARLYAALHPEDVVGMVLVDATSAEQDTRFWSLLPEDAMRAFREHLRVSPANVDFDAYRASLADVRARAATRFEFPLVVLAHGKAPPHQDGVPDEIAAESERVWQTMQAELALLSPNHAHVVARQSAHYIQIEQPKLVVEAVREAVLAARAHRNVEQARLAAFATAR
jgi:pimeloyl-ACP methyl ester carboxylesterase